MKAEILTFQAALASAIEDELPEDGLEGCWFTEGFAERAAEMVVALLRAETAAVDWRDENP